VNTNSSYTYSKCENEITKLVSRGHGGLCRKITGNLRQLSMDHKRQTAEVEKALNSECRCSGAHTVGHLRVSSFQIYSVTLRNKILLLIGWLISYM